MPFGRRTGQDRNLVGRLVKNHVPKKTALLAKLDRTRQTLFGARSLDIHLDLLALGRFANRNIEYTFALPEKGEECSHLEQSVLKESRGLWPFCALSLVGEFPY